ncbi:MAG: HD domain-containing protein [Sandaracinaceae bacterium]
MLRDPSLLDLWTEVETGTSPEAHFVRELDALEPALQATIYEDAEEGRDLSEFLWSATRGVHSDLGIELLDALIQSRPVARGAASTR